MNYRYVQFKGSNDVHGHFFLPGLKLQGATCANNKLSLSTSISTELPLTQLRWIKQSSAEKRHMV